MALLFVAGCQTGGNKNLAVLTTSAQVPAAVVNTAYAGATLTAANGTAPYTWTMTGGALPTGMNLSAAGAISGTPTQTGAFNFTAQVKDSAAPTPRTATASLLLNVNQPPAITSANSTTFSVGANGTFTVTATGSPAPTFSETGALPSGVTLNTTSGVLSGTPAANTGKSYPITITAQNGATPNATQNFTLTVNQAPAITSATSATFIAGTLGTFTVTATGFPAPTLSQTGALPVGVNFNTATGVLTGTTSAQGTYPLVFTAANGIGTNATQNFTLTVGTVPAITSANNATFTVGTLGTFTVTATGSPAPTFSETGALPTGVTLSPAGVLTGTPGAGTGGSYPITITAQNGTTPNATQSFTLTVDQAPAITSQNNKTFSLGSNGSFNVTTTGNPTSTVTETGALPSPVTFVDNGNGTATISGIPGAGTAGAYPITITATNGIGTPASQSFTLTVSATLPCGSGSESLLNGQYTFTLRGFDAGGPVAVGGIFNADGTGKVATLVGIEDVNSNTGLATPTSLSIISANSSYSVGSDHRGCMTIATSAGTQTFRFSLAAITSGVASLGHMVQFDATGSNTAGELRLQNPASFSTSAISGSYAFGVSGPDAGGGKFAMVGLLTLSGGSVVTTGANPSVIDANDKGNINLTGASVYPATPIALGSGPYSIGANGRGSITIVIPGTHGGTAHVIVYPVSTTEFLLLAGDPQSANGLFIGSAMQQSGGPFSTSSLNASSILYTTGLGNNGSSDISRVSAGILTPSSGTVLFSGQQNNGGTLQAQSATGVTYAVATDGRVTFAGGGGSAPLIYLVSPNKGFALFIDSSTSNAHVESGFLEPQTGGPFGTPSANGTYAFGTLQPEVAGVSDESGIAIFNKNTTQVSVTSDNNSSGTLNPAGTFGPISYSVDSTGLGVIPAGCNIDGTTGQDGTCQSLFYILSPTKAVVIDATSSVATTNPHLQTADQ
jgi:hypothetical protein